ncbi:MAG: aldehyde dehydrogenase family protein [Bacteroidota bacterium]
MDIQINQVEHQLNEITKVFHKQHDRLDALKATSYRERVEKLNKIERYLLDEKNVDNLIQALYEDFKKPAFEVLSSESGLVLQHIKYIKRNLKSWLQVQPHITGLALVGTRSYVLPEPKGLTLILAPWNYPLNTALIPLVYSIAAGNAVILKPSEMTPATSSYIKTMFNKLFDEGEIAIIEGGVSVSQHLLSLPFNHIHFTGSTRVGKIVMKAAAEHLTSVTLELGGKSPAIIDRELNIKEAAEKLAWGKFFNGGQTCIAPDYALVHEAVVDDLIKELKNAITNMYDPEGNGIEKTTDLAHVVNESHFNRLTQLISDATEKGAKIEFGGTTIMGETFLAPTIISGITTEMEIMEDEIFGPILPIITYKTKEEAVQFINRLPKPLALYIASRNNNTIRYFVDHTTAGGTVINDYLLGYSNPDLPFGGVNSSGIGRAFGKEGFFEFTNRRSIIKRSYGTIKFIFPPYKTGKVKMAKLLSRWIG